MKAAYNCCCMVRIEGDDSTVARTTGQAFYHTDRGKTMLSCSGVLIAADTIITSAAVISPFLLSEERTKPQLLRDTRIGVLFEAHNEGKSPSPYPFGLVSSREGNSTDKDRNENESRNETENGHVLAQEFHHLPWIEATFEDVIHMDGVAAAVQRVASGGSWRCGWSPMDGGTTIEPSTSRWKSNVSFRDSHPYELVVLRVTNPEQIPSYIRPATNSPSPFVHHNPLSFSSSVEDKMECRHLPITRGECLTCVATPYGIMSPPLFLNSLSRGVVSAVISVPLFSSQQQQQPEQQQLRLALPSASFSSKMVEDALIITDARCSPGSEGGGVFDADGRLMGIILPPMRKSDDSIILHFVAAIDAVSRALSYWTKKRGEATKAAAAPTRTTSIPLSLPANYDHAHSSSVLSQSHRLHLQRLVRQAESSLVLVKVSSHWASGVVVSAARSPRTSLSSRIVRMLRNVSRTEQEDTICYHVITNAHLFRPFVDVDDVMEGVARDHSNYARLLLERIEANVAPNLKVMIRVNTVASRSGGEDLFHLTDESGATLAIVRMDVNASTVSVSSLPPPLPPFPSSPPSSSPSHQENGPHLLDIAPIPFRLSSALRNCGVTANTCYRPLVEGEEVMVLGHAVYGSSANLRPLLTSGIISRLIQAPRPDSAQADEGRDERKAESFSDEGRGVCMVQTDAAVHKGNSGGLLLELCGDNGRPHMIGMITCNARGANGVSLPRLNFSIPSDVLAPARAFAQTLDAEYLVPYSTPSLLNADIWGLQWKRILPQPPKASRKLQEMIERSDQQPEDAVDTRNSILSRL